MNHEPGRMIRRILGILAGLMIGGLSVGYAQKKDTTAVKVLEKRITKEIMDAVTRKQPRNTRLRTIKSEDAFLPYEGKIIRKIIIERSGFERSIYDSARSIKNTFTKLANSLHRNTRKSVIRDNLFFRENHRLNPYLLADNERYIRDLDFILDSKIKVIPVAGSKDSVDVTITTRDVFSLGIRGRARGVDEFSVGVYEANLMGHGQRVQAEFLIERDRTPVVGKGLLYTKSSLLGSLVNLRAGYTELNDARSAGEENEYAYFIRLDRPLVSPYSRMAGGFEVSRNWAVNVYETADSLFRNYKYDAQDLWAGYNIGIKSRTANRNRHFVALRYNRQHFDRQPLQENHRQRRIYNDHQAALAEVTFYNQNFYKTNYIYGFGRTEDVPYGHTYNFTAGWSEELGVHRAYVGGYAVQRIVRPSGRFYDIEVGAGTFFNNKKAEDGVLYINGAFYSKLYPVKKSKLRHYFAGGYAKSFNNRTRELLTLNNELNGFRPDSLYGYQRFLLRSETTVFTPWEFIGFRFAPFLSLEGAYLQQKELDQARHDFFWGGSGGIRIRNENLIFGTIEFRAFFFPTTVPGVEPVSFKVTTNIRIKYSGSFVRPPDFIRYN